MDLCKIIEEAAREYAEEINSSDKEIKEKSEYDFKQGCIYILKTMMEMKISHESIMIEC